MASNTSTTSTTTTSIDKLRILLIPYAATSHIQPLTELAICLAAANEAVEVTVAVTPANVPIVQSLLDREHSPAAIKIVTYPFPTVEGVRKGVENMGKASTPEESLRVQDAALSESLMRPAQEALIRALSPDAVVTDQLFVWNGGIADELRVPCVAFGVIGAFSTLAIRHLADAVGNGDAVVEVPRFPVPPIRIPRTELPEYLRTPEPAEEYSAESSTIESLQAKCFGLAINTSSELEKEYCEMYTREGYVKRAYFLGPLPLLRSSLLSPEEEPIAAAGERIIMDWLDSKPDHSVVYLSFGSLAHVKDAQLDELAARLESSGKSFLWVVRGPPKGWEERVQDKGLIIRAWAPQTAILAHRAVGAFVMQCGWNSIMETAAAGVPVVTWPMAFEQFITERQVTEVLGIGERLWPDGRGLRSERLEEHEVVPAQDVARALTTFLRPGGPGDAARIKAMDLAGKLHEAVAEGGSSRRDLGRLVDDLMAAVAAKKKTT